jgi:hypothetical protein
MNVVKDAKPRLVWRTRHLTLNCPSSVIVSITLSTTQLSPAGPL